MKTFKFILCLFLISLFFSCNDNANSLSNRGVTSSGCKTKTRIGSGHETEYLIYEVKDHILLVTIFNYDVPCDLTKMGMDLSNENNKIVLTPKELDGGSANCYCPMDFTFPIEGLASGEVYHVSVNREHLHLYSFELTFKEGAKGRVDLANEDADG